MGYTISANAQTLEEKWFIVDAKDRILGRLASDVASVLRGKHMPNYTPHVNMQTHVIVINADKVKLTGDKWLTKKYSHHSGYRGGYKETTAGKLNAEKPGELVRKAVWGMLPKNHLGHATMKRLRLFAGESHTHAAQKPEPLPVRTARAE
ncbi:MAG: 50S ribosomal protein L13 [bacterium]|nr:50S ribosomal protein L13 [bacterium]